MARLLLCVQQTTVANHTQHQQPCLKLLEQDVVRFVSCHLTDSYREALTYWRWTEGWFILLACQSHLTALHRPSHLPPASPAMTGWSQMRFQSGFDKLESPLLRWLLLWDEITVASVRVFDAVVTNHKKKNDFYFLTKYHNVSISFDTYCLGLCLKFSLTRQYDQHPGLIFKRSKTHSEQTWTHRGRGSKSGPAPITERFKG